jgi:hypothetical protein
MTAVGRFFARYHRQFLADEDVREGQLWSGSTSGYASHPEGVAKTATVVKIETGLAQPCDIVLLPARPCLIL